VPHSTHCNTPQHSATQYNTHQNTGRNIGVSCLLVNGVIDKQRFQSWEEVCCSVLQCVAVLSQLLNDVQPFPPDDSSSISHGALLSGCNIYFAKHCETRCDTLQRPALCSATSIYVHIRTHRHTCKHLRMRAHTYTHIEYTCTFVPKWVFNYRHICGKTGQILTVNPKIK